MYAYCPFCLGDQGIDISIAVGKENQVKAYGIPDAEITVYVDGSFVGLYQSFFLPIPPDIPQAKILDESARSISMSRVLPPS